MVPKSATFAWVPAAGAVLAIAGSGAPAAERVLVPNAEHGAPVWRHTTRRPPGRWVGRAFDDGAWPEGRGGFGTPETPGTRIGTTWSTPEIWLRAVFELEAPGPFRSAALRIRHDEDVEVYLNGGRIFRATGYLVRVRSYDVTPEVRGLLEPGRNVLAVHCRQTAGGQYIDAGLVLDPAEEPMRRVDVRSLRAMRWTPERAWRWYRGIGSIRGFNYVPRTAVNTTEMWQSLDEETIDEEFGWAAACGLNSARVFVQYLVYEAEPRALLDRMERFLALAARHGISVTFVLFDDCWRSEPALGPQQPVDGEPRNAEEEPGALAGPRALCAGCRGTLRARRARHLLGSVQRAEEGEPPAGRGGLRVGPRRESGAAAHDVLGGVGSPGHRVLPRLRSPLGGEARRACGRAPRHRDGVHRAHARVHLRGRDARLRPARDRLVHVGARQGEDPDALPVGVEAGSARAGALVSRSAPSRRPTVPARGDRVHPAVSGGVPATPMKARRAAAAHRRPRRARG
jgi:hypothetical protein